MAARSPRLSTIRGLYLTPVLLSFSVISPARQLSAPVVPEAGQNHFPPNTKAIEGTVKDRNGAPVPGAIVLLKDTKTLQVRSYIAQQDGRYHFFGLSTDVNYLMRAENGELTSPTKLVSVFDSNKRSKVDLKLKKSKKLSTS